MLPPSGPQTTGWVPDGVEVLLTAAAEVPDAVAARVLLAVAES